MMNRFLAIVIMLVTLPSVAGAATCGPETPFWRRYSCIEQQRRFDDKERIDPRGRLPEDSGTLRSSKIPTEGPPFCADLKTLRKVNYMIMYQGEYIFTEIPCADDELCFNPESIKSISSLKGASAADIAKLLPEPKCVPVHDTTMCSSDPNHRIVQWKLSDDVVYELPVLCEDGMMCQMGKCVKQTAALCKDSDTTIVANGKPNWSSIITAGHVTLATKEEKQDLCKDDLLQEQYCDLTTGAAKMVYVGCKSIDPTGQCESPCIKTEIVEGQEKCVSYTAKCVFGKLTNDTDKDGVPDAFDNCPDTPNTDQVDSDGDGKGDACDLECVALVAQVLDPKLKSCGSNNALAMLGKKWAGLSIDLTSSVDTDADGLPDELEKCRTGTDPNKADTDGDGLIDGCVNMNWPQEKGELCWQVKQFAFDGKFHPEHGETNPLSKDTDQDEKVDGSDPCPANPNISCDGKTCNVPTGPFMCTSTLVYSDASHSSYGLPSARVVWAADSPNVMVAVEYPNHFGDAWPSHDGGKTWVNPGMGGGGVLGQAVITVFKTQNELNPKIPPFVSMSADGQEVRVRIGYTIYVSHDGFATSNQTEGNYGLIDLNPGQAAWTTQAQYIVPDGNVEYAVGDGNTIWKKKKGGEWQYIFDSNDGIKGWLSRMNFSIVSAGNGAHVIISQQGLVSESISSKPDNIFPPAELPIPIVPGPANLSMTQDGALAFYTFMGNADKGCETKYSTTQGKTWAIATQPTPWCPNDVVVTPSGNRAVALISNSHVWCSDKATNSPQVGAAWDPMTITPMLPALDLDDIAISPDGKTMVVAGTTGFKPLEFRIYRITCP